MHERRCRAAGEEHDGGAGQQHGSDHDRCETREQRVRLRVDLLDRRTDDRHPGAVLQLHRQELRTDVLARRASILHRMLLATRHRLFESLHEVRVEDSALSLVFLGEVELSHILGTIVAHDDDAGLIRDVGIARLKELDGADDLHQGVELDRAVDDAGQLPAVQHGIGHHADELPRRARDGGRRKIRFLRLAHLLDIVARGAVHILSLIAVCLPFRRREGDHRKTLHLRLRRLQGRHALLARAVQDERVARQPVQEIRLALHFICQFQDGIPADEFRILSRVLQQEAARREVADARKSQEAHEEQRQQHHQEFRRYMVELHEDPLFFQKILVPQKIPPDLSTDCRKDGGFIEREVSRKAPADLSTGAHHQTLVCADDDDLRSRRKSGI